MVAQDMLHIYRLMESLELEVEFPMVLEMDDSGTVNIANSWSVGGRTCHVDVCNYFPHKLKDQGLIVIRHISGESNNADIFTKNVASAMFDKHVLLYIGSNEFASHQSSSGEAVSE
jgi:pyruvate/2-oxoglutarate dehydrogenase complex dihydrolipoamide dehydrogenase (E3) component